MGVVVVSSPCCPEGAVPFLRASIRSGRVDPSIVVIYADVDYINIATGWEVVLLSCQDARTRLFGCTGEVGQVPQDDVLHSLIIHG